MARTWFFDRHHGGSSIPHRQWDSMAGRILRPWGHPNRREHVYAFLLERPKRTLGLAVVSS